MNHAVYLLGIFIASLFSWGSFIVVINKMSPVSSPVYALTFFYASIFFALTTTFALLGYYMRVWVNKNEVYFSHINTSLRQGALLSFVICISIVFQSMRVLTWWDACLLFLLAVFIEFYFMGREI